MAGNLKTKCFIAGEWSSRSTAQENEREEPVYLTVSRLAIRKAGQPAHASPASTVDFRPISLIHFDLRPWSRKDCWETVRISRTTLTRSRPIVPYAAAERPFQNQESASAVLRSGGLDL